MRRLLFLLLAIFSTTISFGAVNMDGVDDQVSCGSSASIDDITSKSIACWINISDFIGKIDIMSKLTVSGAEPVGGWTFEINEDATISYFNFWGGGYGDGKWTTTEAITDNVKTFVGLSFDNSSASNNPKIYIGGTPATVNENDTPSGTRNADATGNLCVGSRDVAAFGDQSADGYVYECAMWNTILTDAEFALLSQANQSRLPISIKTSNLVFYNSFDNFPSGTALNGLTIYETVGKGNNCSANDGANNSGMSSMSSALHYPVSIQE